MRKFIVTTLVAAFAMSGSALAACPTSSPDAITSKPPADASAAIDQKAADAKGIAEDGQHTPMETDPNAPGVTQAEGGTTTNSQQAETEIADATKTAGTSAGSTNSDDTACPK